CSFFEHGLIPAPAVTLGRLIHQPPSTKPQLSQPRHGVTNWPVTKLPHNNFHQLITSDKSLKLCGEWTKGLGGKSTNHQNRTFMGKRPASECLIIRATIGRPSVPMKRRANGFIKR